MLLMYKEVHRKNHKIVMQLFLDLIFFIIYSNAFCLIKPLIDLKLFNNFNQIFVQI